MEIREVIDILKNIGYESNKNKRLNWIAKFLGDNGIKYKIDEFRIEEINRTGVNILIGSFNDSNIIFSAHHDGDDFNDNLACVSLLLYLLKENSIDNYSVILTDYEEIGGFGIKNFAKKYGTTFPILFLELCGIGNIVLVASEAFNPFPPFKTCRMDSGQNNKILKRVKSLKLPHLSHITPPADHLFYCEVGGSASLISLINTIDIKILEQMSDFLNRSCRSPQVFKFPYEFKKEDSVLSKIPPVGKSNLSDIKSKSMEIVYKILLELIRN